MRDDELRVEVSPKLRLDKLIAHGSFGDVYRGRQLTVARDVAIKVLRAELGPETEPGRLFQDEIRAIGKIDHRNVVRIFDADESREGHLYFVMEMLDGPTLQQIADSGPLAIARARSLIAQLLDGLAAVHSSGHIHADVKPSNAILAGSGPDERVVLIDFGLSRVRPSDRPAEAVGGTRAYMAPEQLRAWEVDARSDVFSAALVLLKLVTGWHRERDDHEPPLDTIGDATLRGLLKCALAADPKVRPGAKDLARALRGGELDAIGLGARPPFRELSPLTELDGGSLHGRAADLARLERRIETAPVVVLTAPSGIGKTSLLRAGLATSLEARAVSHAYVACDFRVQSVLAELLAPGARSLGEALAWRSERATSLVLLLDQVEIALATDGDGTAMVDALVTGATKAGISLVLAVREDFVARLLNASSTLADGVPQVRIHPLDMASASTALVNPFAKRGVNLDPALLERLLDDLSHAGKVLSLPDAAAIYPPHLQLLGGALFELLEPDQRRLDVTSYERLGGFEGIVGGHLDRTLGEFMEGDRNVARAVLLELVADGQPGALRSERELLDVVGTRYGDLSVRRVLERLASRRLVTPSTGIDGIASWGFVHDTLAPRVEAWLTVRDLDRRRTAEVVRFHLRQSAGGTPTLISGRQLREIDRFPGLIEELEVEHIRRVNALWTPIALVHRSREVQRYRRGFAIGVALAISAITALLVGSWLHERALRQQVATLRDLNLGRINLVIEPFDFRVDPATHAVVRVAVDQAELPTIAWNLYEPAEPDRADPGAPIDERRLHRGTRQGASEMGIEIRGGDAFLVTTGRGRAGENCGPSIVPLKHLPGNDHYVTPRQIRVLVPTCDASRFDTIAVPEGPFVAGGVGVPPSHFQPTELPPERDVELPAFAIDRTEITNAAFAIFAELSDIDEIPTTEYPDALAVARGPNYPHAGLDWFDARAYCRFLGKDLPTSLQWQKALRGGRTINGTPNPLPQRNYPWGTSTISPASAARIVGPDIVGDLTLGRSNDARRPAAVGSFAQDRSPYGVLDLAGNLQEWTLDPEPGTEQMPRSHRPRITRGGNWYDTSADVLVDYMAIENPRPPTKSDFFFGARCVTKVW